MAGATGQLLVGSQMRTGWSLLGVIQLCIQLVSATTDIIRLGYLTGSQRLPGKLVYPTPGKSISGAISLAVDEINADRQVCYLFKYYYNSKLVLFILQPLLSFISYPVLVTQL